MPTVLQNYFCLDCDHRFEAELREPESENPQACPECQSSNITVYAVGFFPRGLTPPAAREPAESCDIPNSYT